MTVRSRSLVSQRVQQLAPSGIRRFFDLISRLDNVISLGVGEPDFVTPWRIREGAVHAIERGYTHYTSNAGLPELREAIAADLARRYGVAYSPATEVLVTVGVSEALDVALRAVLDPGDEVIIPQPSYVAYAPCTLLAGGVPVPVPTGPAEGFRPTAQAIEARVTERTRAVLLNYPNNPTGAVLDPEELEAIGAVARRHGLLVISDEVYDRLVYGREHVCVASLPGLRERTVHLGGFSKDYAMTGWRVGYAAAPEPIAEAMMKVHQYTILCAPTPAQYAALEALAMDDEEVEAMVRAYDQRRRLLVKGLREIGLPCVEPHGAFYAFPSIEAAGLPSDAFAEALLEEERVAVVPGSAFGAGGEGHVRCCYAVSTAELEAALERIRRFLRRRVGAGA